MPRQGSGVEVRGASIRLDFEFDGERRRPRLMTNGEPMRPTPANVRYAERLAAEIKDKIRLGCFSVAEYFPADAGASTGEVLTFGRQLDTWLAAQRIEASTRAGYSSAVRFWKGVTTGDMPLGDRPLRSLKHSHFLLALATRPSLSGKTVNNYVSIAHQALDLAVLDGILKDNPADKIPRAAWQKEPPDPFELHEVELILGQLDGQVANMVEFWAFTGLRTSELAGLKWSNVDLASGYVQIREALVRGVAKDHTKTGVVRNVLLNSRSLAALQRQRQHSQVAGEHVFLDPRYGTPWTEERAFRRSYWTPTLKRLGIRYRRPYCLRHTFATMMLMAGRTPGWCANQMGHSVEMFLGTYTKWISGGQDARELAGLEAWLTASTRKAV